MALIRINPSNRIRQLSASPLARQLQVLRVSGQLLFYWWWDRFRGGNTPKRRHRRARWLVKNLIDLGPTFIKIGQALSTRADLIPIEYIEELGQLQDRVPAFDSNLAIAEIESELGKPIYALFRDFDPMPLAAASLGQVHKARLHTGEEVVVKVQRPGLEALFNLDFEILHQLVRSANRFLPGVRKYRLEGLYQEFFALLFQEIDYVQEGKNAERFRHNFSNYPQVLIPQVYWQYTTRKVLTMEYLPGIKIDDRDSLEANNINTKAVIQLGVSCYLKQLLQDGFFQSDPHPGNMAVAPSGAIVFYDFGTMTEVKSVAQDQMVKTLFAIIRKDTDEVVETLVYLGLIEPMPDMTPIKRIVNFILEEFRDKPIDLTAFERFSGEIYRLFQQQPFRLPPQMTFIIKSLTTLDGIARALDPQYNLLAATQPFVRSIALSGSNATTFKTIAQQAKTWLLQRRKRPNRTELLLQRLESRLESGEIQVRVRSESRDRALVKIQLGIKCLIYACLFGCCSIAAAVLLLAQYEGGAIAAACFAAFWLVMLLRYLIALALRERIDRMIER